MISPLHAHHAAPRPLPLGGLDRHVELAADDQALALLAALLLTPLLYFLPTATLAATIIVAVLSLVDLGILGRTWRYSKADFTAVAATILLTLGFGVEAGVSAGVR